MKHFGKKFLSLFLVFIFVFGCVPDMRKIIHAGDPVKYLDYNYETKSFDEKMCEEYTPVTSSDTEWSDGWYVVDSDVTISERITVTGEVNLILCDDFKLTAEQGISVTNGNTFKVYGETEDNNGTLEATCSLSERAGIGGGYSDTSTDSTIVINGGTVISTGGSFGAGIGGSRKGHTITINGGKVTATGDGGSTGIGGASGCHAGVITINGGTVVSTGCSAIGSGSGGGGSGDYPNDKVIINDGVVTATGSNGSAGIGSSTGSGGVLVTINGGLINATGKDGAGIGTATSAGGPITINGGVINATSNSGCGIGTDGTITINNGIVNAIGVDSYTGIGGNRQGQKPDKLVINGGTVKAIGADSSAGIGGYITGTNGFPVIINGGTVEANGDSGASGIGKGSNGSNNEILKVGSGISVYGDDDEPIGTKLADGPQDNVTTRKRYMKTIDTMEPAIEVQPTQSGEIVYGESENRKITGAELSNEDNLGTVTRQWYSNTFAGNIRRNSNRRSNVC